MTIRVSSMRSYRILFTIFGLVFIFITFYLYKVQFLQTIIPEVRADHWVITSPGTYQYRQKITLNSSLIIGTLTNFPVFISFTSTNLMPSNNFVKNSNGYDIVFASADHAPVLLPHERTFYDTANGKITAWVLIPSLSATTNEIYVYYGNISITTSQSNPTAVWGPTGANYKGVWHLDETLPCSTTFADATGNGLSGTCFNVPTAAAGQINGARNFIGAAAPSDGINIASLTLNPTFTYEAWVRPTSVANYRDILGNTAYTRWFGMNNTDLRFFETGVPPGVDWVNVMTQDSFQHIAFTADSTSVQFYRNGFASSPTVYGFGQITDTFAIGYARGFPNNAEYFAGQIDEVRISNGARSAGWIQTSYNNQANQDVGAGKFILTLGARQMGSRPFPPTLAELPSFPNRYTPATTPLLGTFSTTDPEGDPLEYEIQWDDDSAFLSPNETRNSSAFGTNGFSAATFTSGAVVSYTVKQTEAFPDGVIYWWRVRARDTGPTASGLWSDYSLPRSITINTALPEEGWFQTSDAQFSTDTLTNAAVTGTGGVNIIPPGTGTIRSSEIDFDWVPSQSSWGQVIWSTNEPAGTDVRLRIYYTVSTPCDTIIPSSALPGNASPDPGFDISASPLIISALNPIIYNRICLEATFTAGTGVSPTLNDWRVTWFAPGVFNGNRVQSSYRWYQNADSLSVGAPVAAQNTPATSLVDNETFRLRVMMHVNNVSLPANAENFRLQFAPKVGPTCGLNMAATDEIYSNVTNATAIAFADNPNAAAINGALVPSMASDPQHDPDDTGPLLPDERKYQSYQELGTVTFTNNKSHVTPGKDGVWDFVLRDLSAPSRARYCFRMVRDTGVSLVPLNGYAIVPEIMAGISYVTSGVYISNAFAISPRAWNALEWRQTDVSVSCPSCSIKLQIQTSTDRVSWQSGWCGPNASCDGTNFYTIPSGTLIPTIHNNHRWIRYRATFAGNGNATPILEEVRINYQQ